MGGHQRLSVLRDLGETMVDCVVVDLDELKEKALNVALNKVQGRWDEEKLAELLTDLDANAFDVSMTGFDAAEVDELMNRFYSREAVQDESIMQRPRKRSKSKVALFQRVARFGYLETTG